HVAILRRKPDQGLAEKRVDCHDLLIDGYERNQRSRIAGIRDAKNVSRSVAGRAGSRAGRKHGGRRAESEDAARATQSAPKAPCLVKVTRAELGSGRGGNKSLAARCPANRLRARSCKRVRRP